MLVLLVLLSNWGFNYFRGKVGIAGMSQLVFMGEVFNDPYVLFP